MSTERKCEICGILVISLALLLFLALASDGFNAPEAPGRPLDDAAAQTENWLGAPGAMIALALAFLVGDAGHAVYLLLLVWGMMLLSHRPLDRLITRVFGLAVLAAAIATLLQVNVETGQSNPHPGGTIGLFVANMLVPTFGAIATNVVAFTFALIGLLLATDFLCVHVVLVLKRWLAHLVRGNLLVADGARKLWREHAPQRPGAPRLRREQPAAARAVRKAPRDEEEAPFAAPPEEAPRAPAVRVHTGRAGEAPLDVAPEHGIKRRRHKGDDAAVVEGFDEARAYEETPEEAVQMELPDEPVPAQTAELNLEQDHYLAATEDLEQEPAHENQEASEPDYQPARRVKARRKTAVFEELPADYEYPKRYTKPPIDMLDESEQPVIPNLEEQLRNTSVLLEDTLQTFGIEARVMDVTRGPTITRFELEPAPGIKVSRFNALADDLALALKAHRVRVEAPIPGKGRVGIEAPNAIRDQVLIRELLENSRFRKAKSQLPLALGKGISGDVNVADLAAMPHLLVAGATGAGKTVCIKALLASLLFSHTPDDLQLMLIDPKMVELSVFNDIPHLITPVVTDPKKASTALGWLIHEMEERYRLFADLRVRNIEIYNQSVENGEIELEGADGEENETYSLVRKLPYIVCIIDELADLMMLARAEVEDSIGRLAQLARAVGIHLIIATQRPSVDVLTGVIKANFPARMSFQVSSRVDSRCILDEIGAERLIGMGDMLYLPAGQSKPQRIQGAFVSDEEMNALVAYLKTQAPPQYRDEIARYGKKEDGLAAIEEESDPLFEEAVQVVMDTGQASISMVQRRLRVGYTRAARLIDMMEMKGIVGPHTGSKAREILIETTAKD